MFSLSTSSAIFPLRPLKGSTAGPPWLLASGYKISSNLHGDKSHLLVLVVALVSEPLCKLVDRGRAARAKLVLFGLGLVGGCSSAQLLPELTILAVDPVENGGKDLPRHIQLVVPHKVAVVTLERIKDERLVRLGDPGILEPLLVREIELCGDGAGCETGELGVHLEPDSLVGLNTHDELVTGDTGENAGGGILVLDADDHLGLVQR